MGIDLPLKGLAWEDADGQVWLGCNDVEYLARRHGLMAAAALPGLNRLLVGLIEAAAAD